MWLKRINISISFLIVFVIFAFFMFYRLGTSMFTADSHFWYQRSMGFVKSIKEGDLLGTYQNPKPGVPIMWLSGFSIDAYLNYFEAKHGFRPFIYISDTFPSVDFAAKLPLVLLTIFSVLVFYLVIKSLTNELFALLTSIFLMFQIYFIGVSRFFHGDGTLTAFMTISVVLLIYYLVQKKSIWFLILSGLAGGLAFLTKLQAVYLLPYTALIICVSAFINKESLLQMCKKYLIWLAIFTASVFLFFPALWVKPIYVFQNLYREATQMSQPGDTTTFETVYLQDFVRILNYPSILFFLTGLVLFIAFFKKTDSKIRSTLLYSLIFIFFYLLQMQLVKQKSIRYLLPLYPFISVFCAYGFYRLTDVIKNIYLARAVLFLFTAGLVWTAYSYMPNYTAMTETKAWGSLTYDAAQYLNQKRKANLLNVVVIPKPQTFKPFFSGTTYDEGEKLPVDKKLDYLVVSGTDKLPEKFSFCTHEHSVEFKQRIFWNIYKCR